MRRRTAVRLLVSIFLRAVPRAGQLWAQGEKKQAPPPQPEPNLKVGDTFPDFTLLGPDTKKVSLHDFKGKKNVALAFVVFAFTGG